MCVTTIAGFLHCDIMMPEDQRNNWTSILGPCFQKRNVTREMLDEHQQHGFAHLKYMDQSTIVNTYGLKNHLLSTICEHLWQCCTQLLLQY